MKLNINECQLSLFGYVLYTGKIYLQSGLLDRNYYYAHPGRNLDKMLPSIASKTGAILKIKNLLPEGANSFL